MIFLKLSIWNICWLFFFQTTRGQLECGHRLIATRFAQNLTSPGWPAGTNDEVMCTWDLAGIKGSRISIMFEEFDLREDEVLVIMSDMDTVSLTGSPCLEPYISSSSEVQITFTSNTGQGRFFATFQITDSFPAAVKNDSNLTTAPCGFNAIATNQPKKLDYRNSPRKLYRRGDCFWTISAPEEHQIKITFIGFAIATCCNILQITDEGGQNRSLSGYKCPKPFLSKTNRVTLRFTSTNRNSDYSFQTIYQVIDPLDVESTQSPKNNLSTITNNRTEDIFFDSPECPINKTFVKMLNCVDGFFKKAPFLQVTHCRNSVKKIVDCFIDIDKDCLKKSRFNTTSSRRFKVTSTLIDIAFNAMGVEENRRNLTEIIFNYFCFPPQQSTDDLNSRKIFKRSNHVTCSKNEITDQVYNLLRKFSQQYHDLTRHKELCSLYTDFTKNLTTQVASKCEKDTIPIVLRNLLPERYDEYIPEIILTINTASHYVNHYELSSCSEGILVCKKEQIVHDGFAYTFNKTKVNDEAISLQLCNSTGIPLAAVRCVQIRNIAGGFDIKFNISGIRTVPCGTTISSFNYNTIIREEEIQTLSILTSKPEILDEESIDVASNILSAYLNQTENKVSRETLRQTTKTVANLITSSNLLNNETEKSTRSKSNLYQTLNKYAATLSFPPDIAEVDITTPDIDIQVKQLNMEAINRSSYFQFNIGNEKNSDVIAEISERFLQSLFSSWEDRITLYASSLSKRLSLNVTQNTSQVVSIGSSNSNLTFVNMSITFQNTSLPKPSEVLQQNPVKRRLNQAQLVTWDYAISQWVQSPCKQPSTSTAGYQCRSLGSFTLLFSSRVVPSVVALTAVSYIGSGMSIFFLVTTIAIYLKFEELRKKPTTVLLVNICLCLILVYLLFAVGINQVENKAVCDVLAFLLHFAALSCLTWMAVNAYQMHKTFTSVAFVTESNKFAVFAIGYGLPFLLVLLNFCLTVLHLDHYEKKKGIFFESLYRARFMCWLQPPSFNWGFLLPMGFLLLYNYVVFAILLRKVAHSQKMKVRSTVKDRTNFDRLINAISITTMMGLTWIFGYFLLIPTDVTYESVMQWLFTIFNIFQGVGIFYFYCLRLKKVRKVWLKRKDEKMSSSTAPNSSSKAIYENTSVF